ncbi:MAG: ABC transporter permease [Planctomycetales bacterium]|nr:ABC transporter permease [Planctomycetales bacterium]
MLYALIMAMLAPGFASIENFSNVLVAMLPLMIVATGQTAVLITAGIDLSVTSVIALTSVAGASLVSGDTSPLSGSALATPIAILAMLATGALVGMINGSCVAWLRMPAFVVTLTMMMFASGFAVWTTQSQSYSELPASLLFLGKNGWASGTVALLVAFSVHFMLHRTRLGTSLFAIGHNPETALVSGVRVQWAIVIAYVICGCCAAVASVLILGQLETGSPVQWENNLLDVVGATVIGGTSLYGGRGSVLWTFFGVLLLTLIDNSLNLMNLSHFSIMMIKGCVILLAAFLDTLRHREEDR